MGTRVDIVLDRAAGVLNDPDYKDWTLTERLGYLNEAIQAVVRRVPTAYPNVSVRTLTGNEVRQTIPSDGVALIGVRRAVNPDGSSGRAVTRFDLEAMDAGYPDWTTSTPGPVRQWAPDPFDPRVFWVYPRQPSTGEKVELEYAAQPPVVKMGENNPLDPRWDAAIVDFILYRAFGKDAEYANETNRSATHYQAFLEATGGTAQ